MTATNGQLVEQIRQAVTAAHQAGQPAPGRPTLVRLTGATDHAVRRAMAELAAEQVNAGEPDDTHPDANVGASAGSGDESTPGSRQVATGTLASPSPGGRLVAWTGFVFGSVMSIAANVLHAWLLPVTSPPGGRQESHPSRSSRLADRPDARGRGTVPNPLAEGFGWSLARFGGAGAVATGSAVISYGHLRDVLLAWSCGRMAAAVGPLVLDGLMVVCGFALLAISRTSAAGADDRQCDQVAIG